LIERASAALAAQAAAACDGHKTCLQPLYPAAAVSNALVLFVLFCACCDVSCLSNSLQAFSHGCLAACMRPHAEEAALEVTAYEFFEQAFVLYEESIPDSRQEVRALQSIIGTLNRCACLPALPAV
jgi:hypothetical protein